MKLHELKFAEGARKRRKRVGRGPGSGHGMTSTRGGKGLTARSGAHNRPGYEGGQMPLMRRIPKRGFHNTDFQKAPFVIVKISDLEKIQGVDKIDPEILFNQGLIKHKLDKVKVLGDGELTKKIIVIADAYSASAKEKILAKGGVAALRGENS